MAPSGTAGVATTATTIMSVEFVVEEAEAEAVGLVVLLVEVESEGVRVVLGLEEVEREGKMVGERTVMVAYTDKEVV